MADLVQFSAQVAVVVCPLGPRARTFIGRVDNSTACPDGLLPPVTGSGPLLIEIFRNKTIAPHGLTALIGAHTTSQQFFVNTSRAGDPQDSTPGIWDVRFYSEVLNGAPPRVFTFPSDVALSQAPETQAEFLEFANDGQEDWNEVSSPAKFKSASGSIRRDILTNPLGLRPRVHQTQSSQCASYQ